MRTSRKRCRRRVELAGEAESVFFFFEVLCYFFFYLAPSLIFLIHVTRNKEKTSFFFLSDKCELTAGSDEKKTQFLPWLRISVVRASGRQSEDPSAIPGGAALRFFRLIQLSVHICRIEKRKKFD